MLADWTMDIVVSVGHPKISLIYSPLSDPLARRRHLVSEKRMNECPSTQVPSRPARCLCLNGETDKKPAMAQCASAVTRRPRAEAGSIMGSGDRARWRGGPF